MKLNYDVPISPCQLADLIEDLSAGCDPAFDADLEELERQFAEFRLAHDHP